jgi:hypothetical protein
VNAPDPTPVDRLFDEASAIVKVLEDKPEPSLQIAAAENLRKILLLAAASHFENKVCALVLEFVRESTGGSVLVEEFVRNKAVARQYHTWFDWDTSNANKFFRLFGPTFLAVMDEQVKSSTELRDSIGAFLEIGRERNLLLHQDYATFAMEKTMEEIYTLYKKALLFIEKLPLELLACDGSAMR